MGILIGMAGLKGSGKNTFADFICKNNDNFITIALADVLKDAVSAIFGWDREMLEGKTEVSRKWREEKDEYWSECLGRDFTPRKALQEIGTDVFRNHFDYNIWVNAIKKRIIDNKDKNIIITDVRFKNEYDMIKSLNGTIIRVDRGEHPSWWETAEKYNKLLSEYPNLEKSVFPVELNNIHRSEWDLIGYKEPDWIVNNNDTLETLEKISNEILKNIIK